MPKKKILVTTEHQGVFAGIGDPDSVDYDLEHPTITLEDCQMCIKWSSDMHGVFGLASKGPSESCRIGPKVGEATLADVTGVFEITEEAYKKWGEQACNF